MINPRDLRSALLKKGFKESQGGDHDFYFYYEDGIKTKVRTKISHGSHGRKPIGDTLTSIIKDQMHFEEKEQLIRFVECTFSAEDYREMLHRKKIKL